MTYPRRTFREREVHTWWVDLGVPLAAGERRVLRISYHGDVLERQRVMVRRDSEVRRAPDHTLGRLHGAEREEEWIVLRHPLFWYPYPLFSNRAAWDLTFRVPRRYPLVASGELVSEHDDGDGHVSRWVTRDPAYLASFYVGFLRGVEVSDAALRPLRAWFHSPSQSGRRETLTTAELAAARGTEESVARDIARAVKFYTESFGPPRVTALNAVESPDRVYLAFPGLVHMMRKIDQRTPGLEHSTDYVRAHELAHQWWGYGVTPRTYHDVWLNEAFADFSALWYVQAGRGDVNSYLQILRSMRQSLMDSRRSVLGTNQEAGPIWLGPRNESSRTPGDYQLVTYKKGAWVLHMLRNLMVDVQSGDDTPFRELMRDFYQRHVGGLATTEDFRAAAERAMDQDLGWFFDQWVYGTEEPRYRVTWRPVRTPEGQWAVKLVVHQSGVHERFRMPVLVRLEFEGGQYARARVWVNGPVTELTLPATALEPQRIAFNDLESVLCQVESVKKE
jgi:aminopeptidase N